MSDRLKARLTGLGSYLPEKVLSNQDLEKIVDTTDDWIFSRTGIKQRCIAHSEEMPSDMGAEAAKLALKQAHMQASDIDIILVATMTGDYISPSTASLIQVKIGAHNAAALDIQAACTGYIYGLSIAKSFIESGIYKNVLLIASEKMSSILDYSDRNTCVLFGDGASAAVISSKGKGLAIETVCLGADGELAELVIIPGGGSKNPTSTETIAKKMHFFKMEGKEVFKHAVRRMSLAIKQCLLKAGMSEESINWMIPHQANIRIMEALAKNFSFPSEKIYKTIHKYGNTSAASVAIALDELTKEHEIAPEENLLLVAFGGGLTWGAALLKQINGDIQ